MSPIMSRGLLGFRRFYHYFRGADRIAITDETGTHSYIDLLRDASHLSGTLSRSSSSNVGILVGNESKFVKALWSVWAAGRTAVPLCPSHPSKSHQYFLENSESELILASKDLEDKAKALNPKELLILDDVLSSRPASSSSIPSLPMNSPEKGALILYTSGTTGAPKGVLITHSNLNSQINAMVKSWAWTHEDHILHVLPLHHVHGLINCLLVPLSLGARVKMMPVFDAPRIWRTLQDPVLGLNVFMAVPTIYSLLSKEFEADKSADKEDIRHHFRSKYRLMVSGSASLPEPLLHKWEQISGHILLERYGMTEIGMALGNPLEEDKRLPGCVGTPFQSVEARIVTEDGTVVAYSDDSEFSYVSDQSGELQIRGPSVFAGYFNNEGATKKAFDPSGWFLTGDTASMSSKGVFKILGRTSADIIKYGGFKLSALQIEREYLSCPEVSEIAVLGLEDETFGEIVAAVIVCGRDLSEEELKKIGEKGLPPYAVPTLFLKVDSIAKNNMGKVNKKELKKLF